MKICRINSDLPQILVPHVKLEFSQFLFINSGTPLVLEDGNLVIVIPLIIYTLFQNVILNSNKCIPLKFSRYYL